MTDLLVGAGEEVDEDARLRHDGVAHHAVDPQLETLHALRDEVVLIPTCREQTATHTLIHTHTVIHTSLTIEV